MPKSKFTPVDMHPLHPDYDQYVEQQEQKLPTEVFQNENLLKEIITKLGVTQPPNIHFLQSDPTEKEKNDVITFKSYHLKINKKGDYQIGFAKKKNGAEIEYSGLIQLDEHSPLYVYLDNHLMKDEAGKWYLPDEIKKSFDLETWLTQVIEGMWPVKSNDTTGIVINPLFDTAAMIKQSLACVNKTISSIFKNAKIAELKINPVALKTLQRAVGYGQQDIAKKIIDHYPHLLLSQYKADITDVSEARTFHDATPFQVAVWNGDWFMWNMMIQSVEENKKLSPEKKQIIMNDLKNQFNEVQEKDLLHTIDTLHMAGVTHLKTAAELPNGEEPSDEIKQDTIDRDAYCLIEKNDGAFAIGFAKDKQYVQHDLDPNNAQHKKFLDFIQDPSNAALFNRRYKNYNYQHKVIHDKTLESLVRPIIDSKDFGGKTRQKKQTKMWPGEMLNQYLNDYVAAYTEMDKADRFDRPKLEALWCKCVGWSQRQMPANAWQWKFDRSLSWDPSESEFLNRSRPTGGRCWDGLVFAHSSSSLGDNFSYVRRRTTRGSEPVFGSLVDLWGRPVPMTLFGHSFFRSFFQASTSQLTNLNDRLNQTSSQPSPSR